MKLDKIDLLQLSDKELIRINARLPKPKQKILGDIVALPVTIALGCQIELITTRDLRRWLRKPNPISILIDDSKKVSWGNIRPASSDSTDDFLENGGDYLVIGDACLHRQVPNHVDCYYSTQFFTIDENNLLNIPIQQRSGWCCTMSVPRNNRTRICDRLVSRYLDKFKGNEWLCYDGADDRHEPLFKHMFRTKDKQKFILIESSPTLEHDTDWNNVKFSEPVNIDFTFHKNVSVDKDTDSHAYVSGNLVGDKAKNKKGVMYGALLGPWHQQSLIELVPEATMDYFDPTEKTVKPIRAGMPFIIVGSHRCMYRLRKMGFRTFSPFIDESYDKEPNEQKRCDMALDAMFKFLDAPGDLQEIEKICKHNQDVLRKINRHDHVRRIAKKLRPLISY